MTRPARRPGVPLRSADPKPALKPYTYGGNRPWGGKWSRDPEPEPEEES